MKRVLCGSLLLLLLAGTLFAQQQSIPPYNSPPVTTPPTFPQDPRPGQPLPPDTKAPAPLDPTNAEVQDQVQHKLATEPLLERLKLKATVTDAAIVLTGTVDNEQQHKLALRVAESYAGERQVIDKIKIRS
jgi:hypothetical protein